MFFFCGFEPYFFCELANYNAIKKMFRQKVDETYFLAKQEISNFKAANYLAAKWKQLSPIIAPTYFNQIYSVSQFFKFFQQKHRFIDVNYKRTTVASCSVHFQLKWPFGKLTKVPSVQSASDSYYVTLEILIIALV